MNTLMSSRKNLKYQRYHHIKSNWIVYEFQWKRKLKHITIKDV